jgi:hypothetical protein
VAGLGGGWGEVVAFEGADQRYACTARHLLEALAQRICFWRLVNDFLHAEVAHSWSRSSYTARLEGAASESDVGA